MAGEDESVSFDPRSWGKSRPPPSSAPIERTADSFDPRSWSGSSVPPRDESPILTKNSTGTAAAERPRYAAAGGAAVAILLIGALLAHATRDTPTVPQATVAVAAPTSVAVSAPVDDASRRSLVVASAGDLGPALAAAGVPGDQTNAAVAAAGPGLGTAPGEIRLVLDLVGPDGHPRLTRLEATREAGAGVTLTAKPDGSFTADMVQADLKSQVKVVRGEMDATSFYNAAVTAGITDSLISPFAAAFSFDFDFQRDVKPGDVFEAAFEQKINPSGDAVGTPTLIYVSLSTQQKSKALYRFLAPGDAEPGWYDGNGRSTVRALMRTPVDGARISSTFGMRMHPVLGFMKMHKGIDFAAPIGTPIYAAGDGTVEWAAMKGPNGNLTILQHDNGWETYYLHQSMFMPGVVPGARVHQGQQIGAIGTTGRSTGPHLHYEVHINKEAVDPAGIDTGTGKSLSGSALEAFRKERDRIDDVRAKSAA